MRLSTLVIALLVACNPPVDDPLVDPDPDTDTDTEEEVYPRVGDPMPAFALEDINPSSPTYGQFVGSAEYAGHAYGVIFLDARCTTCVEVAEDLYGLYEEHPAWWEGLPLYMVNGPGGAATPILVENMVANHSLPYLQDVEEGSLWYELRALNHDWYVVDEEGVIEDRLELYVWPADTVVFTDFMTQRYGQ